MTPPQDLSDFSDFGDIPDPLAARDVQPVQPHPSDLPGDAPRRAVVHARRAAALSVSLGWLGMHLAVYGIRSDFPGLPLVYSVTQILVPFAFAVVALWVATSAGKLGLGASIGVIVTFAVLGPASFLLIALGAPEPHAEVNGGSFWLNALVCLDITLAWAAVPLLTAAVALRHSFPVASRWRAALVGGSCGLASGAVMNLHCSSVDRFHIALGHGIPVLVTAVLGALVLSRWVRI